MLSAKVRCIDFVLSIGVLSEEQERREKEALRERLLKDVGPGDNQSFLFLQDHGSLIL